MRPRDRSRAVAGDIKDAHRTGEFIEIAEAENACGILEKAIQRFCG